MESDSAHQVLQPGLEDSCQHLMAGVVTRVIETHASCCGNHCLWEAAREGVSTGHDVCREHSRRSVPEQSLLDAPVASP